MKNPTKFFSLPIIQLLSDCRHLAAIIALFPRVLSMLHKNFSLWFSVASNTEKKDKLRLKTQVRNHTVVDKPVCNLWRCVILKQHFFLCFYNADKPITRKNSQTVGSSVLKLAKLCLYWISMPYQFFVSAKSFLLWDFESWDISFSF